MGSRQVSGVAHRDVWFGDLGGETNTPDQTRKGPLEEHGRHHFSVHKSPWWGVLAGTVGPEEDMGGREPGFPRAVYSAGFSPQRILC